MNVSFGLCDSLNPGFGYQIRIVRESDGAVLLFTSKHPVTGRDLDYEGCLEVAAMYRDASAVKPVASLFRELARE